MTRTAAAPTRPIAQEGNEQMLLCGLCRGTCSLFCSHGGRFQWWTCPACQGRGVQGISGPAAVAAKNWQVTP